VNVINPPLNISLGSKSIGIISYVAIVLLALSFALPYYDRWEALLVAGLLLLIYSLQASKINYVVLIEGKFLIQNIFSVAIQKDASLFHEVIELIPFTKLMRISFVDGSNYLFWGKSEIELNRLIRERMK
jgi:hypothetical protein